MFSLYVCLKTKKNKNKNVIKKLIQIKKKINLKLNYFF